MNEQHSISLQPGTVIGGKYEVVKCLGSGSMGLVYACRHRELQGQLVAVKVLFPEVAQDKVACARFKNEILASYGVSHPNVVRAYEYLSDRDLVAYTMEFVGGGDLAEKLANHERLSISEIIGLLGQMAAGCQAIHDAGIVHRDLKPENILLTTDGVVKIADFGIARNRHGPKLTEHGGVVGTIDYVAPEYMLKSQFDWRSDIYALGILAYEMVTGGPPFDGDSMYATMTKRLKTDPVAPSSLRHDCPVELDKIILKAMQRDPESRYQSALEMLHDVKSLASTLGVSGLEWSGGISGRAGSALSRPVLNLETDPVDLPASKNNRGAARSRENGFNRALAGREVNTHSPSSTNRGVVDQRESLTEDLLQESQLYSDGRSDTEIMPPPIMEVSVDEGTSYAPYSAREPLVDTYARDVPGKQETSFQRNRSVDVLPPRYRNTASAPRSASAGQSFFADLVALGFAAAVGIGCGFMFLKVFAPSLLDEWHF